METVAIEQIILEEDVWPRQHLDRDRVDTFRGLYATDGPSALPPLTVIDIADGYLLADGWHRCAALEELGSSTVPVTHLNTGGRDGRVCAYEEGLRSCATSAKPLNRAERDAAIVRLSVQGGRTDREIGRLVGVSHQTVARVRAAGAGGPMDQPSNAEASIVATSYDITRRLVRSVRRIWDERGVTNHLADRLPRNLADALVAEFGDEDALVWAGRLTSWASAAQGELEGR